MTEAPLTMILEEWEAHPKPLHTARMPWPEAVAVPRSVAGLKSLAEEHGWKTDVTYSQGYVPTVGTGKVKLVHTILVRMTRTLEGGVIRRGAVYYEAAPGNPLKWVAKECTVLGVDHWPAQAGLGVTALQEWVRGSATWTGPQVDAWAAPWRLKVAERKVDAANKAKLAPKKARVTA